MARRTPKKQTKKQITSDRRPMVADLLTEIAGLEQRNSNLEGINRVLSNERNAAVAAMRKAEADGIVKAAKERHLDALRAFVRSTSTCGLPDMVMVQGGLLDTEHSTASQYATSLLDLRRVAAAIVAFAPEAAMKKP